MTTPNPPHGPQQPYPGQHGQPTAPQQGYPGQGPMPPQQGYPGQGQMPPQYPAEPPKKKSPVRRIVLSLVAVGVVAAIAFGARYVTGDPDTAAVGDCLSGSSANEMKVVDCTDAGAQFKVLGKVEDKSQTEASVGGERICQPYAGAERIFWKGEEGGKGYVLCLGPAK